jgi:taurine dioxygenase
MNIPRATLSTRRLAKTFASEIQNFNISDESVAEFRDEIHESYLENKVLVFRGQDISPTTFSTFGEIFGEADRHHVIALRHPEAQNLTFLTNQDQPGRNAAMKYSGEGWHSDYSYKMIPSNATMLLGLDIPEEGGDTLFADVEAAFDDLPDAVKRHLRTLRVRHQYRWSTDREDPWARWKYIGPEERRATPEVVHPLVRRHPNTGREVLFISARIIGSIIGIEGLDGAKSDAFVDDLMSHITNARFVYRHRWRRHDVVVWDNRCVIHCGTAKALPSDRVRRLLRLTTKGSPVTPSDPAAGFSRIVRGTELD